MLPAPDPGRRRPHIKGDSLYLFDICTKCIRSMGEGNVFTGVCLSTGGVYLGGRGLPWEGDLPWEGVYMERGVSMQGRNGQPVVGTHLTGMHSRFKLSEKHVIK